MTATHASAAKEKGNGRKPSKEDRNRLQELRKAVRTAEAELARLTEEQEALENALNDPSKAAPAWAKHSMADLAKERAAIARKIEAAEATWLEASEALEAAAG